MASESKIQKFTQEAGYEALEGRCIIVRPAPDNLSEKIVSFLKSLVECDMCVLQMCENELILLPFAPVWTSLRKEATLVLPYEDIESVELADDLLIDRHAGGIADDDVHGTPLRETARQRILKYCIYTMYIV